MSFLTSEDLEEARAYGDGGLAVSRRTVRRMISEIEYLRGTAERARKLEKELLGLRVATTEPNE